MVFEWDEAKNQTHLRKHGLSFELARSVFTDPLALIRLDLGAHGEERWRILGTIDGLIVVLVAYTVRGENPEVIRIISAREATNNERKRYEEG